MKARFEIETVHGLRDRLTCDAIRWQAEAAALWADLAARRPSDGVGDDLVVAIQRRLETDYRCARELVGWASDEPYLAMWCKRINRRRRKEAQKRQRRVEVQARRWAAMTPRQRDAATRVSPQRRDGEHRHMVYGLLMRDVQ